MEKVKILYGTCRSSATWKEMTFKNTEAAMTFIKEHGDRIYGVNGSPYFYDKNSNTGLVVSY